MRKRLTGAVLLLAAAAVVLGCASQKDKYQVSAQTPASFITAERSPADIVEFEESSCPRPGFAGGAFRHLETLLSFGERRTGTQALCCAAAWARQALASWGYEVQETVYYFPFYDYDLAEVKVIRQRDGLEFPAQPFHYSPPTGEELQGRVCRPRRNLTGCLVYVNPEELNLGDLKLKVEKWKQRGALGVIREATLKPFAGRGHRHPALAHAASWYYSPLPAWVVENARELVGETVSVRSPGRIRRGTGHTLAAFGPPSPSGWVIITAHLDAWYQGALDDGTGTAALLEAARLLKDDAEGLLFLLADSEEIGLLGSAAFVQEFALSEVSAVIELDMVSSLNNFGRGKTPENAGLMPRVISWAGGTRALAQRTFSALQGGKIFLPLAASAKIAGGVRTDYLWFYEFGIPGVFLYTPSRFYHTELDTSEWIPGEDLQAVAEATADLARALRGSSLRPPREILPFDFTVQPAEGSTVEFTVSLPSPALLAQVSVHCFYEMGFDKKVKLEREEEGWKGSYQTVWPGRWQFLAVVSEGARHGRRWQTLVVPEAAARQ